MNALLDGRVSLLSLISFYQYFRYYQFSDHFLFLALYLSELYRIQDNLMNKSILILIALSAALIGWSAFPESAESLSNLTQDPPKTVPFVDVAKYLGAWHQQAVIPYYFERNCERTVATYSLNKDSTIRVDNVCYRNGNKHQSVGKAFPDPEDKQKTNAKLKVQFLSTLDIEANYWIVRLDKDYSYSVVSSPNYRFLWILYREPNMPESLYQAIYNDLKKDGFPVEKLKRTVQ